jgi:hypothetical protein
MPQSNADQIIAESEQLKKPRRRGTGPRRPKTHNLYQQEMQFSDPLQTEEDSTEALLILPPPELQPPASLPPPKSKQPSRSRSTTSDIAPLATLAPVSPSATPGGSPSDSHALGHDGTVSESHLEPTTQQPAHNPPKAGAESSPAGGVITVGGIDFHHASEAEFARLLNYYGIEWEYEPHQFALQWRDGKAVEMFTPDFYLTEFDMYIELTTMRQSLVRRKNRKLRLIRALYPEINIKLLYRRDYHRLLERFGIPHEVIEAEMPSLLQSEE